MRTQYIIGLIAAVAAVPVVAQTMAPPAMGQRIATRAEVQAMVQTQFARADANRDGYIDAKEMVAMRGNRMAHGDKPGPDGMRPNPGAMFDRIDTNRDGMISRDEFTAMHAMHGDHQRGMNGQRDGMKDGMRGMHGGGMMGMAMIKMADANHDGRITLAEATSGALQHFDMADTNRDGSLTPQERQAAHAAMKQMRQR